MASGKHHARTGIAFLTQTLAANSGFYTIPTKTVTTLSNCQKKKKKAKVRVHVEKSTLKDQYRLPQLAKGDCKDDKKTAVNKSRTTGCPRSEKIPWKLMRAGRPEGTFWRYGNLSGC